LIKELVKDKNVGAIVSTSTYVVNDLVNKIDFDKAKVILEYGPGNGVITKQLLKSMQNDAVLFVFETNKNFVTDLLKINDKRLVIINADAEHAKLILKNRYKIEKVDYIISSIPFTFFSRRKRQKIIFRSHSLLKEQGKFITYQYTWLIYSLIKQKFTAATISTTILNIPPAFILEGIK